MLRDGSCAVEVGVTVRSVAAVEWSRPARRSAWQDVDRALRRNARQRSALDAEEARLLCEAERLQVWRPLGMVSMIDYLERVLGYAPRTAQDRMRVARALANLPALTEALAHNEVTFSAVKELVRVATPTTEVAWLIAARDKNLRQIEELVVGHTPGDVPERSTQPRGTDPRRALRACRLDLRAVAAGPPGPRPRRT